MLDERIQPYVPQEALQRPAGAVVNDGMVTCVTCSTILPIAKADIVGLGYRCVPCSHKAHVRKLTGGGDAASHLSANERSGLRESGTQVVWGGAGLIFVGVVLIFALFLRTGAAAILTGIIAIAIGLARKNAGTE
jgi:hypothetical protein